MSISRRGFIGGAGAGAVASVAVGSKAARAGGGADRFMGHPGSMGLLHDTTLCVGCRSCELACTKVNSKPKPAGPLHDKSIFSKLRRVTDKLYTVVNRYVKAAGKKPAVYRKHQCMHCQEPCCASVCFVKAFTKTPEGPVLYDPSVCVGCRYCVNVCPYYALGYEYDNAFNPTVQRCTMCYTRIKKGEEPGCAQACPMGAIVYGKREDLLKLARQRIAKFPDRYVDQVFGEHEYGGTSWLTIAGVTFDKLGLPVNASHKPLPELTAGFLSIVPLVITIYPGLLLGFHAWTKRKERLAEQERLAAAAEAKAAAEAAGATKAAQQKKLADSRHAKAVDLAVKKALAQAAKEREAESDAAKKEDTP